MFVDSCAMISMLTKEATAPDYDAALSAASDPWTSPLAAFEAVLVLGRPDKLDLSYPAVQVVLLEFLALRGVALRQTKDAALILTFAVTAADLYGTGKRKLCTIDCLYYAYARASRSPLLTFDRLLRDTDIATLP